MLQAKEGADMALYTTKEKELADIGELLADVSLCDAENFINLFEFDEVELDTVLSHLFSEIRKRNFNKGIIKRNCGVPCIFAPRIMIKLAEKRAESKIYLTYGKRTWSCDNFLEALKFCQCLREMENVIKGNIFRMIRKSPGVSISASPVSTVFVNWPEPVKLICPRRTKRRVRICIGK